MPYKKTSSKSKSKSKTTRGLSAKQVANIARKALMKQAETKMYPVENQNLTLGPDDVGYMILDIDNPAQGTDNEQRVGDKILGRGLQFKYNIANKSANRSYFVRVVVFQAQNEEFTAITDGGLLLNTANEPIGLTANSLQDIQRSLNRKEFQRVFYDKVHKLGKDAGGNTTDFLYVNKFFKLKDRRTFPRDTNDQSENRNFRIMFIVRDSQGATVGVDQDIQVTAYTRYYYKDF